MNNRVMFVGQAPSKSTQKQQVPFSGRSGVRLAALLGTTLAELHEKYRFVNILDRWPGGADSSHPRGDRFPMCQARRQARKLMPSLVGSTVVLCGKNVRDAFGFTEDFFEVGACFCGKSSAFCYATIPHPSGVNHWWNAPENVERAGEFLREFVQGV
jgi:uracil-DNA glycosylase